jgi:hypothetical protein
MISHRALTGVILSCLLAIAIAGCQTRGGANLNGSGDGDGFGWDDWNDETGTNGNGNGGGSSTGGGFGNGNGGNGPRGNPSASAFRKLLEELLRRLNLSGHPGLEDPNIPLRIRWAGPTEIETHTCYRYSLTLVNMFSQATSAPQDIRVDLSDTGSTSSGIGSFHTSASCSQNSATASIVFQGGGSPQRYIYYKSATARQTVLKADGKLGDYPVIGRYGIGIRNKGSALQFCANFEDLPGGDMDYNDFVAKFPANSPVYIDTDGSTVRAFQNGSFTMQTQGTSGCGGMAKIRVYDPSGNLRQEEYISETRENRSITFNVQIYWTIKIIFRAKSYCDNGWFSAPHTFAKVRNTCRSSSDEGNAWNGN